MVFFQKGYMVGNVTKVQSIEGKSVWRVEIRFSEKYAALENVYIIKNLFFSEMLALQNESEGN